MKCNYMYIHVYICTMYIHTYIFIRTYVHTVHMYMQGPLAHMHTHTHAHLQVADEQFVHGGVGVEVDQVVLVRLHTNTSCLH